MSALSGGLYRPGIILVIAVMLSGSPFTLSAPVYEHDTTEVGEYEGGGAANSGCYYNFQRYREGDRIITNEPCLNCTCHNRMLMCYLRVCPFTKAIGQNCKVEKRPDQCCSVITCPQVTVHLLTSTTNAPESSSTDLGFPDNYGCSVDDKFYADGAQLPIDSGNPCELCYCIRNRTTCVMQECTLRVSGCNPVYLPGVCCPVKYNCDYEEEPGTTIGTTPGLIMTTTIAPKIGESRQCSHEGRVYEDGDSIYSTEPCQHCYCFHGDIACAVQDCGTPMQSHGKNCTALPPQDGECCPSTYECEEEIGSIDSQQMHEKEHESELTTEASVEKNDVHEDTQTSSPVREPESFPGADNAIPEVHEPRPEVVDEASILRPTESAAGLPETQTSSHLSDGSTIPSDEMQSAVPSDEAIVDQSSEQPEPEEHIKAEEQTTVAEEAPRPTEASLDTTQKIDTTATGQEIAGGSPAEEETTTGGATGEVTEAQKDVTEEKLATEAPSTEPDFSGATKDADVTQVPQVTVGSEEPSEILATTVESTKVEEEEHPTEKTTETEITEEGLKPEDDKAVVHESPSIPSAAPTTISDEASSVTESAIEQTSSAEPEAIPTTLPSDLPETTSEQTEASPGAPTTERPTTGETAVEVTTGFAKEEEATEERVTEMMTIPEEGPTGVTQVDHFTGTEAKDEQAVTESGVPSTQAFDTEHPMTETSDTSNTSHHPSLAQTTEAPVGSTQQVEGDSEVPEKTSEQSPPSTETIPEEAVTSAGGVPDDSKESTPGSGSSIPDDVSVTTESANLGPSEGSTVAPTEETSEGDHIHHVPTEVSEHVPTESSQVTSGSEEESVEEATTVKVQRDKTDDEETPMKVLTLEPSSEETSSSEESGPKLPTPEEGGHGGEEISSEEVGDGEKKATELPAKEPVPSESTPGSETSEPPEHLTESVPVTTIEESKEPAQETSTPITPIDGVTEEAEKQEDQSTDSVVTTMMEHSTEAQSDEGGTTTERVPSEQSSTSLHEEESTTIRESSGSTETSAIPESQQTPELPTDMSEETKGTSVPESEHPEATSPVSLGNEDVGFTTVPTDHSIIDEKTAIPAMVGGEDASSVDDKQHQLATEEAITSQPEGTPSHPDEHTQGPVGTEPVGMTESPQSESAVTPGLPASGVDKPSSDDTLQPTEQGPEHTEKIETPDQSESTAEPTEMDHPEQLPTESTVMAEQEQATTESGSPVKMDEEATTKETPETTQLGGEEKDDHQKEETASTEEASTLASVTEESKITDGPIKNDVASQTIAVETEKTPITSADESSTTLGPDVSTSQVSEESSEGPASTDLVQDIGTTTIVSKVPQSTESILDTEKTTTASGLPESTGLDAVEKTTIESRLPESTDLVGDVGKITTDSSLPESTKLAGDVEEATTESTLQVSTELGVDAEKTTTESKLPESTGLLDETEKTTIASSLPGVVDAEKTTESGKLPESPEVVGESETPTSTISVPESTDPVKEAEKTTVTSKLPDSTEAVADSEKTTSPTVVPESTDIVEAPEGTTVTSEGPESPEVVDEAAGKPATASESPATTEQSADLATKTPVTQEEEVSTSSVETTRAPVTEEEIVTSTAAVESEAGQVSIDVSGSTEAPIPESSGAPAATNLPEEADKPAAETSTAIAEPEPTVTVTEPVQESIEEKTEGPVSAGEPTEPTEVSQESVTEGAVSVTEQPTRLPQEEPTSPKTDSHQPHEEVDESVTQKEATTTIPIDHPIIDQRLPETEMSTMKPAEVTLTEEPIPEDHSVHAPQEPDRTTLGQESTETSPTSEPSIGDDHVTEGSTIPQEVPEEATGSIDEHETQKPFDVYGPPAGIPGEGNCLVEGQSYANNTIVPSSNPCQLSCHCFSSIVQCELVKCSPPPHNMENCMPVHNTAAGESCCPIYFCDSMPTINDLEAVNQMKPTGEQDTTQPPVEASTLESTESAPTAIDEKLATSTEEPVESEGPSESPVSEIEKQPTTPGSPVAAEETTTSFEASSEPSLPSEEPALPAATSTEAAPHPDETPTKIDEEQKQEENPTTIGSITSTEKIVVPEESSTTSSPEIIKEVSTEQNVDITENPVGTEQPTESSDEPSKTEAQTLPTQEGSTESVGKVEEPSPTESDLTTHTEAPEEEKHPESSTEAVSPAEESVGPSETTVSTDSIQTGETVSEHTETSSIAPEVLSVEPQGMEVEATTLGSEQPQEQTTHSEDGAVASSTESVVSSTEAVRPADEEHSTTATIEAQTTPSSEEGTSLPEVTSVDKEKSEIPSPSAPSHTEFPLTEDSILSSTPENERTQEPVDVHPAEQESSTSSGQVPTSTDHQPETSQPSLPDVESTSVMDEGEKHEGTHPPMVESPDSEATASPIGPEVPSVEEQSTEVPAESATKADDISTQKDVPELTTISNESPVESSPASESPSIDDHQAPTEEAATTHGPIEAVTSEVQTERPEEPSSVPMSVEETPTTASAEIAETTGDHLPEEHGVTGPAEPVEEQTVEPVVVPESEKPAHQEPEGTEDTVPPHHEESLPTEESPVSPSDLDEQTEAAKPSSTSEASVVPGEDVQATEAPIVPELSTEVPKEESTAGSSSTEADVTEEAPRTTAAPPSESFTPVADKQSTEIPLAPEDKTSTEMPSSMLPSDAVTEIHPDTDAPIKDSTSQDSSTAKPEETVTSSETSPQTAEDIQDSTSTFQPHVSTEEEKDYQLPEETEPAPDEEHSSPSVSVTEPIESTETPEENVHQHPHVTDAQPTESPTVPEQHELPEKQHHITPEEQHHITPEEQHHITPEEQHKITPEEQHHITPEEQHHITPEEQHHITPEEQHHITPEEQHHITPDEETIVNDTMIETGAGGDVEYPEVPVENEENPHFPVNSGSYLNPDEDYDEDDQAVYGPGTCRYGGKVYVSAQQIPRDDPCDFCFCFRSDIICLQQSCPPPIPGCHEEPIRGFCCPRYECPVSMATSFNLTTTTTTTTTTLPPHFLSHAYKGATKQSGCQIRGQAYSVGQAIKSASGPCLQCSCGGDGNMKCDPRVCSPEPTLRRMIAAATARRRR